ncbi:MAG TPA: TIGR02757 family protein [Polyangiaceae bacterium]|nr:TIGR02757 family protein [Polyangiaceae bacterium]
MTARARVRQSRPSPERERAIFEVIQRVDATCDRTARIEVDPIGPVRRYKGSANLELAGLVGACLAFGNAKALRAKVSDAFDRLGPELARVADDELAVFVALGGWKHRVYRGEDVARLIVGARRVQRSHGSLERCLSGLLRTHGELRAALAEWVATIRTAGGLDIAARTRRGAAHILPDPAKTSGCKRLLLYLRWMVRPDDGVDLGLWKSISPSILLVPVDTHLYKLSRNLGFTRRSTLTWATTEEVTAALRRIDPDDPVRFDFSLCHLGMLQRCPSRRDEARCEGCGIKSVCRHWRAPSRGKAAAKKRPA